MNPGRMILSGPKEYFENSATCDISLASFMKHFIDIQDKDRFVRPWRGSLSLLQQHSSLEKCQLYGNLCTFTHAEIEKIVDKELQEVG
ncbi:hypothetical protein FBU30_002409 [Linnemannia zychae]|nr:hypothetical protein FBU30_002409 [Linnemannia zychae]